MLICLWQRKHFFFGLQSCWKEFSSQMRYFKAKVSFSLRRLGSVTSLEMLKAKLSLWLGVNRRISFVFILTFSIYFGVRLHMLTFKLPGISTLLAALSAIWGSLCADLHRHCSSTSGKISDFFKMPALRENNFLSKLAEIQVFSALLTSKTQTDVWDTWVWADHHFCLTVLQRGPCWAMAGSGQDVHLLCLTNFTPAPSSGWLRARSHLGSHRPRLWRCHWPRAGHTHSLALHSGN